ncbi:MAG: HNH endonuclease [Gammaproteobacteria bacterium]|nr:HNH endonuclease [Gammaproteobacteria bacterium]
MPRKVKEWFGKTDNSAPSRECKLRILDRQDNKCALTGHELRGGDAIEFDHKTPLWLGGENREKNLQAVLGAPHKRKSKVEAGVRAKVKSQKAKHLLGREKSYGFQKPPGTKYNWKTGRHEFE